MNLQQIEYVLAVAELQYFGIAAKKCFVTQPTLSTMISRYEEEIGIKIFDRKTKPVTVTKEGATVIEQLKIIQRSIIELQEKIDDMKGEMTGTLKIGIIPTVAPYLLPKILPIFTKTFPKINFLISEIPTQIIIEQVSTRQLDIGIVAIPLQENQLLETPLYHESFVLFDCQKNGFSSDVVLSEINYSNFWLLQEEHCLSTQVVKICDLENCAINEGVNFEFKAGSIDSLIRFVKLNKGVTLLPYLATLDFTIADKKKLRRIEGTQPLRTIGMVTHQHFVKRNIIDILQTNIQNKMRPILSQKNEKGSFVSPLKNT